MPVEFNAASMSFSRILIGRSSVFDAHTGSQNRIPTRRECVCLRLSFPPAQAVAGLAPELLGLEHLGR